ncbi:2Fe-2S iron-sulfur cluster-binding protein, partial [Kibdelosporangium lantanae]
GPVGTGPDVTFTRSGLTVPWNDRYGTILELAEACDVPTRWSCRTGVCHTCVTPVLSGELRYQPDPLEPSEPGTALVCCAQPVTDLVVDTTSLSVHQLRAKIEDAFGSGSEMQTRVTVLSFGYKYGLPMDSDLVMDVRFLPNPFWIPELREQTGLDGEVRNYVLSQEGAEDFLERYHELLRLISAGYRREGKRYLTLAVGCTGGKHRSVAISEELATRLSKEDGVAVKVVHGDLGRE